MIVSTTSHRGQVIFSQPQSPRASLSAWSYLVACHDFDALLSAIAADVGIVSVRLGYIEDIEAQRRGRYTTIPRTRWPSAHAAFANWFGQIGRLAFEGWDQAVRDGSYFVGPYFQSEGQQERNESIEIATDRFMRVCWNFKAAQPLFVRMAQERAKLVLMLEPERLLKSRARGASHPVSPGIVPKKSEERRVRTERDEVVAAVHAGNKAHKEIAAYVRKLRGGKSEPSPKLISEVLAELKSQPPEPLP